MRALPGGQGPVVVCAADERFAAPLAVMVRSLIESFRGQSLRLSILDAGFRAASRRRALASWEADGLTVEWVKAPLSGLRRLGLWRRYGWATYLRLLIPELLPATVKRAIYLDSDLLVLESIDRLWEADLAGLPLGAVGDAGVRTLGNGLRHCRQLGLPPAGAYFNAGVLVLDLARWRKERLAGKVLDHIERYRDRIRWPDQDALNAVLAGRWQGLDPRWNVTLESYGFRTWRESPYPAPLYRSLLERPAIVHFLGWSKPWRRGTTHPRAHLYYEFLGRTRWAGSGADASRGGPLPVRPFPPPP